MSNPQQLVQKLWNYWSILQDDCLCYGDFVEQLKLPLFLKMADAQAKPPLNKPSPIPRQTRIVAKVERQLSVVEELAAVVFANLQRATRLRRAMLQRAFTGKLA
jgi:hypothetical protein